MFNLARVRCGFIVVFLLLCGCSKSIEGVYQDKMGVQKHQFTSDGKVYSSTIGLTTEGSYVIEDKKIKITYSDNTLNVFSFNSDGSIKGPLGLELRLQQTE